MYKRQRLEFEPVLSQMSQYSQPILQRSRPAIRSYRSWGSKNGRATVSSNVRRDNSKKPTVKGISPQLKRAIKAVLDGEAEWKMTRGALQTTARGTIASADISQWMPGISQGTTNGTRIGNEINVKKLTMDILIAPIASATVNPFRCRILIFRPKDKGYQAASAGMASDFYDNGSGSFAGTGVWSDLIALPNPDLFEVLVDKLTPTMQWCSTIPTASNKPTNTHIIAQGYNYQFTLPQMYGKLHFDDNSTVPSKALYLVVQAIDINLNDTNAAGTTVADVYVQQTLEYLDA